jgi:hypothetical protein
MTVEVRFMRLGKVVAQDIRIPMPPRIGETVIIRPNGGSGRVTDVEWDIWKEGAICTVHFERIDAATAPKVPKAISGPKD